MDRALSVQTKPILEVLEIKIRLKVALGKDLDNRILHQPLMALELDKQASAKEAISSSRTIT
jgi:hypothetical protein